MLSHSYVLGERLWGLVPRLPPTWPGTRLGWYYQALINLTTEDNLEYFWKQLKEWCIHCRYFMWLSLDTTQEENWRVIVLIPVNTCEYAHHSNKGFMKLWKVKRCLLAIDSQLPCCCSFCLSYLICWSGTDNSCKWEELLTDPQESLTPFTLHQTAWVHD